MDLPTESDRVQVTVSYKIRTFEFYIEEENVPYWLEKNQTYQNSPIFQELFLVRVNPIIDELETIYAIVKRKEKIKTLILNVKTHVGYSETVVLPNQTVECSVTVQDFVMTM